MVDIAVRAGPRELDAPAITWVDRLLVERVASGAAVLTDVSPEADELLGTVRRPLDGGRRAGVV